MKIPELRKLFILLAIPVLFIACDNYRSQFVNKEKITGIHESMSKGDLDAGSNYAVTAWPAPYRDVRNLYYNPFSTSVDIELVWIEPGHAGCFR